MMLRFGFKKAVIGMDEILTKCPACEVDNYADIMVLGNYFHIWYIPVVPTSKEVNIVCQKCGLRRYQLPFNSRVIKEYDQIKHKFKYPWYMYAFVTLILILIIVAIIV